MKPNDKSPEEMLDDIREAAVEARSAAYSLAYAIIQMRDAFPNYPAHNEIDWWRRAVLQFTEDVGRIANRAEELADADKKGGREMKGVCLTNVLKAMDELAAEREAEEAKRKAQEREKEAKHDD